MLPAEIGRVRIEGFAEVIRADFPTVAHNDDAKAEGINLSAVQGVARGLVPPCRI